jgi:hypothetical protein
MCDLPNYRYNSDYVPVSFSHSWKHPAGIEIESPHHEQIQLFPRNRRNAQLSTGPVTEQGRLSKLPTYQLDRRTPQKAAWPCTSSLRLFLLSVRRDFRVDRSACLTRSCSLCNWRN